MDVTVIICTYNRSSSLLQSLESLREMRIPSGLLWELIIVDNNSTDDTQSMTEKFASASGLPIRYVKELNQGLSFARNRGIREARGEIVTFTDDDVTVDQEWIPNIFKEFSVNNAACIGGKILPVWEIPKPNWLREDLLGCIALLDLGDEKIRLSSPTIWGANLSYRAEIFQKYGLFDTTLGHAGGKLYGGEEVEYNSKLLESGENIFYCPSVVVKHHISKNRMKKSYFRKWFYDKGELKGIQMGSYDHRNIYGIPLYKIRQLPMEIINSCFKQIRYPRIRLQEQKALALKIGFIAGRIKYTKMSRRRKGMSTR